MKPGPKLRTRHAQRTHLHAQALHPSSLPFLLLPCTQGEPKAIPWTHVTPLRCAADGWAHQGIVPGDVVAWPTSLGEPRGCFLLMLCMDTAYWLSC